MVRVQPATTTGNAAKSNACIGVDAWCGEGRAIGRRMNGTEMKNPRFGRGLFQDRAVWSEAQVILEGAEFEVLHGFVLQGGVLRHGGGKLGLHEFTVALAGTDDRHEVVTLGRVLFR